MFKLGLTNVSVASIYSNPRFNSESVTQACLGEELEILELGNKFSHVRMQDGYEGWIDSFQLAPKPVDWDIPQKYRPYDLVTTIYENQDTNSSAIRDVTIVSELPLLNRYDGWVEVRLPDDSIGWLIDNPRHKILDTNPDKIISTAARFLGIQYLWGGRTPKGFDCSGLVQTVFALNGITLPRDSYKQAEIGVEISDNLKDWKTGDLVFFSFYGDRITHVAIVVDEWKIIHSSGFVRFNSMRESEGGLYNPRLNEAFVKACRIL